MRFDAGTVDIPTAGTRVQVSNTTDKVRWIRFHAKAANTGLVFVGRVTVSATVGRALSPDATTEIDFRPGSVIFNVFYVDTATNGNDVDWEAILGP